MGIQQTGEAITPSGFWQTLGARPVSATLVTTRGANGPSGFLGLSFAHVSAIPPTVLVSVGYSTGALADLLASKIFAVSALPAGESALARGFGGELPPEERFNHGSWAPFVTGAPVLADAVAVFDCTVTRTVEEEGAVILIGRVVGLRADGGAATIAHQGGYVDVT
ncbi:flavin reductase [Acuticoccus sediminis]|uniref:Flavin reductase n=1 Tax=Acuticoccus sediminis TaxID=2184697 RepID=A0A8B2NVR9_9HYPH|nr:flavin reductase family protein [Acuticoccus sediminis]RAI02418.1 flavin reductase [Acuticoccus sediminis]